MKIGKFIVASFVVLFSLLIVSVFLNFYLFNFSRQYYLQLNGSRLDPLGLNYFADDTQQLEERGAEAISVVFFGDSRAAEWPNPTIDGFDFINRGIGAQTSVQVLQRYDAHIQPLLPDILVVQVCINDLKTIPLFPELKRSIIVSCKDNIQQITERASEQGATVILSTVFPIGQFPIERKLFWSEDIPLAVNEVNSFIKSLEGDQVVVFDAFALLADESGQLQEEFNRDELHLNLAGYDKINQEFVELVKSLN